MKSMLWKAGLADTRSWDINENALCVISALGSQQCSLQLMGNCSWRMQRAQGAVGDPPEKQPRLSMFPSFHSELLPLKWAVIIGPEPPWVHLQVGETCSFCSLQGPLPSGCACSYPPCSFDAIGRAANLVIAAAASNKYLT